MVETKAENKLGSKNTFTRGMKDNLQHNENRIDLELDQDVHAFYFIKAQINSTV